LHGDMNCASKFGVLCCAFLLATLFSPPALGQSASAQNKIRVKAEEVIVPVTVVDKQGEAVLDLTQDDFHVFDNGVEQKIDHWDFGGDPLAVALVVETSEHIEMMAPVIRGMGSIFTETVMAMDGEAAVISYDSTVDVHQPFTQDHDAIEHSIAKLNFDAPVLRLYDAMAKAVQMLREQPPHFRRVMLIVGESQDTASDAKLGLVLREAELASIAIYAVGPSSTAADLRYGPSGPPTIRTPGKLPNLSTEAPGPVPKGPPALDLLTPAVWLVMRGTNEIKNHQLEVAAAATGGVHYRALRDSSIRSALDRIGGELHTQYILSYALLSDQPPGFHEIRVTVTRENVRVRARPGYFIAPEPVAAATSK